jgi:hypothetical protein
LLTGIAGSNPEAAMDICQFWVSCKVSYRSVPWADHLSRKDPKDCGVSECDLQTSTFGKPRPTEAVKPWKKKATNKSHEFIETDIFSKYSWFVFVLCVNKINIKRHAKLVFDFRLFFI